MGVGLLSVNLGPHNISENTRARKLKLKTPLDIIKYSHRYKKKISRGVEKGTGPPNVNLGPPTISETTRATMLKLKTQLDIVKYSLWVKKYPLGGVLGA